MTRPVRLAVAPMFSAALFVFSATLVGCREDAKPATPGESRLQDKAYIGELEKGQKRQIELMKREQPLRRNMERMRARARDVLGKDATDAQVIAELDANPGKYPGWRELKAQAQAAEKSLNAEKARMRAVVRARILKEAAEKKAAKSTK